MTNRQLMKYHTDISQLKGHIFEIFFLSKIKEFYNQNGIRVKTLSETLESLTLEYFQLKEGKLIYDENKQPIPLEGKDINEYSQRFNELMDKEINIIL